MGLGRGKLAAGAGLSIGAALGASATAEAADFTVTNLNDAGAGSLRQAILDANAAPGVDRVLFQAGLTGTVTLTSGQITIDEAVQLLGPGSSQLAISGNGASRIFYSYPTTPQTVTISGLTLTNGVAATGGAIRVGKTNLILSNAVVTGNRTTGIGNGAAGVYAEYGSLSVQSSTISGNTAATGRGGGIRTYRTPISIQNSTISGNTTTESGGRGGGVYAYRDSLTVQGSTISGNAASGSGGGIHTFNTAVAIERSTVSGNSANGASSDGGGIYAFGASMAIQGATIAGNAAGRNGGGISTFNVNPDPSLTNTIVGGDTAPTGPELFGGGGDVFTAAFSLIQNPVAATVAGNPNITGQDPRLGPLADNGGPTLTQALLAGSPALDAGSATGSDQRGAARPFDLKGIAKAPGGNAADIGAYEEVLCAGKLVNRVGTDGDDVLTGTPGPDGILGLGGKDRILGLSGKDNLCGGSGKDKLKGGAGKDKLLGQAGRDTLIGGKGHDILKGGKGKDKQVQ
jgi:Ca2+-binding RTX toxin-like protein